MSNLVKREMSGFIPRKSGERRQEPDEAAARAEMG